MKIVWHDAQKPVYQSQKRRSLLRNDSVNTFPRQWIRKQHRVTYDDMQRRYKHAFPTIERLCLLSDPCKIVTNEFIWEFVVQSSRVEFRDANLPRHELGNRGTELSWQLENNGKKRIKRCREDFMCNLKWQWDCYKSVVRIRLVKTENPSVCAAVNCKVCRPAQALYLFVVPSCAYKVSINPIHNSKPRL
jgi:hypothetical protein